jgi:hypothetical protein
VTASTGTIAALAAFPSVKALIQSLPVWAQFLLAVLVADLAQALLHRAYHNIPGSGASTPCTTPPGGWTGWRVRASTCWRSS